MPSIALENGALNDLYFCWVILTLTLELPPIKCWLATKTLQILICLRTRLKTLKRLTGFYTKGQ